MITGNLHPAVAIFAFNRPSHIRSALESLSRCEGNADLDVHIFCDGSRDEEDEELVSQVRKICRDWSHPRMFLHERRENAGLAKSISEGMEQLFVVYESAIVVEDDLILHADFLKFHRQALVYFADRKEVMEISGYRYTPEAVDSKVSLLPLASSWGWSTWRRAWQYFDLTLTGWPPSKDARLAFDVQGVYPYSAIADRLRAGQGQSWAIAWYWAIFCKQGLVAYPPGSLAQNFGFDGSGTHCERLSDEDASPVLMKLANRNYGSFEWPSDNAVDPAQLDILRKQLSRMAPSPPPLKSQELNMKTNHDSVIARIFRAIRARFKHVGHQPAAIHQPPVQAPVQILESDPYDRAYKWAWEEAGLQELVRLCYKTPDFAENARRFAKSEEFKAELKLLNELGVGPAPGRKALDFGCGNGVATYSLASAGYDVLGIDSSNGLLAGLGAARQLEALDGVNVEFRYHDGERLKFADETFDLIYVREVLHHIRGLPAFLSEIGRILKRGGVVCCLRDPVVWNDAQREDFFAIHPLNHITKDEGCYTLESYLQGFSSAGLRLRRLVAPTESVINTYPLPFDGPKEFDYESSKRRQKGHDLFSFFAQKID